MVGKGQVPGRWAGRSQQLRPMFRPPFLPLAPVRGGLSGSLPAGHVLGVAPWLALWVLAWLAWTALSTQSPPVDNAEQLSWVRSLEWGYYKHPPLPTAVLWPLVQALGLTEWASYAAAGLVTGGALLLLHGLMRQLLGAQLALLGLLGTLCIGYYSLRLAYFNHDTLLMLAHLAAAACAWRAFAATTPQAARRAWWGVGLALGLGGLAKYQVALSAGAVFVFWVLRQGWREARHRRGLLQAGLLAGLVLLPHLVWLVNHQFLPFDYARQSAAPGQLTRTQCSVDALRWVGQQLGQLAGPLLLGLGLQLHARWRRPAAWCPAQRLGAARALARDTAPPDRNPWHAGATPCATPAAVPAGLGGFLVCFGLLPLLWMPAMAVLMSARLHLNWGTAFMPLTCAALLWLGGARRWQRVSPVAALAGFVLVQALMAAWVWQRQALPRPVLSQHRSAQFDSQHVADAIAAAARPALGGPVTVIAGRQRLVSVLALRLPERPLVLVDGRPELSPWLPDDLSALCAVLWVGDAGDRPPAHLSAQPLPQGQGLWWAVEVLSERSDRCPAARPGR